MACLRRRSSTLDRTLARPCPANRVDEKSVISGADFLPTLCAITGVKINASDFDGEDTSAAWLGKSEHVRTKPLLWKTSSVNSDAGIRDGQWKLIYPSEKRSRTRTLRYRE